MTLLLVFKRFSCGYFLYVPGVSTQINNFFSVYLKIIYPGLGIHNTNFASLPITPFKPFIQIRDLINTLLLKSSHMR